MGLGTGLMKSLMFVFNGIVWVLGLVLFVVGIVVLVEGENWNEIIDGKTVPVSVLLIIVGLVIAIVGFLGCFGAMKQNSGMLLVYAIVLGVVILVQLVAGILAFIYSDEAENLVRTGLDEALVEYGKQVDGEDSSWTMGIDWLQANLECCGVDGAEDWSRDMNISTYWISASGGNHELDTPDSCCLESKIADGCGTGAATGYNNKDVYTKGCYEAGKSWLMNYTTAMGVCGFIFIIFEVVCAMIAGCLGRRVRYE